MTRRAVRDTRLTEKYDRMIADLQRFQRESRPDASGLPREVRDILDYIHAHLFEPGLNVNAVKVQCGIRNNNISTRFRHAVGLGIREYIEALRLDAADSLLRREELEIYLVAMAVGYDHQETFYRAFQRRFARTPSRGRNGIGLD
ncbi:MAG TPA: AraC family transcriptional regulator [Thermoanaerobaculia bacterium]|jgi:AraC-like DNA-binding protein|nr:AraC family transcriptional regulator [Thermoanaerobaculia bacterium]